MGCPKLTYRTEFLSIWRRDAYEKSDHGNFLPLGEKNAGEEKRDNYYPFGLKFNSYSRESSVPNTLHLFQDQEHIDDLGLNWDSFKWRNHMPDIGRFFNIDPLAEKYVYNSTYAFSENKVTSHVEIEGLEAASANATQKWGTMTVHSNVGPNAGMTDGHAWLQFKDNNGNSKTLSLWGNQGSREFFANKEAGQTGVVSRTVDITNQDVQKINDFNSEAENVDWTATNTCAGYSSTLWNTVTGENLESANVLGVTTPANLAQSIVDANGGQNTNTATTPNANNGNSSGNSSTNSGSSTSSSSSGSSSYGGSSGRNPNGSAASSSAASSGTGGVKTDREIKRNYTDTVIH
jgi:hypothetical protein